VGGARGAVGGTRERGPASRASARVWRLGRPITPDPLSRAKDAVRQFVRVWRTLRPPRLFGHAHSIYILACLVDELRLTGIRPNAIVSSSMMLVPHERAVIERVFGTRVTDFYGCEEVGGIASECERHEGMHINADQLIVEVLREDGTPAGPGEFGAVVVTDLLNLAMPMIRYRIEDMAEVSDRPCSCGRGLATDSPSGAVLAPHIHRRTYCRECRRRVGGSRGGKRGSQSHSGGRPNSAVGWHVRSRVG